MEYQSWIVNVLRDIECFAELSGLEKTKNAVATAIQHAVKETLEKSQEKGPATILHSGGACLNFEDSLKNDANSLQQNCAPKYP